jgi:hypothetical protein
MLLTRESRHWSAWNFARSRRGCKPALHQGQNPNRPGTSVSGLSVRGVTLESLWPDLSVEHKASVKQQPGDIFRALREGPQSTDLNQGGTPGSGGFASAICKDALETTTSEHVPDSSRFGARASSTTCVTNLGDLSVLSPPGLPSGLRCEMITA